MKYLNFPGAMALKYLIKNNQELITNEQTYH